MQYSLMRRAPTLYNGCTCTTKIIMDACLNSISEIFAVETSVNYSLYVAPINTKL